MEKKQQHSSAKKEMRREKITEARTHSRAYIQITYKILYTCILCPQTFVSYIVEYFAVSVRTRHVVLCAVCVQYIIPAKFASFATCLISLS